MLPDDEVESIYLLYDERMLLHRPIGWVEPEVYPKCSDDTDEDYVMENPQRLVVIYKRLMQLENRLLVHHQGPIFRPLKCQMATRKQILMAHSESYYNRMEGLQYCSALELLDLASQDNYYCSDTFTVARLAAGGLISCVDAVCDKTDAKNSNRALALVRPPGHHACQSQEMGFCFIDSVVVAAKYALRSQRAKRIVILDWDIHDGNGTSEATKDDDNIFRIDLHRYNPTEGFYPFTGGPNEVGFGSARGLNLNVGWTNGGVRNQEYAAAFCELVLPLLVDYNPDLLIISCGLDAAKGDLLGGCELTAPFFYAMTKSTLQAVGPDAHVVCALEGGYAMHVLPDCMEAVTLALLNYPYEYYSSVCGPATGTRAIAAATTPKEPTLDRLSQARMVLSKWYRRDIACTCKLQYCSVLDINMSIRIFKSLERWSNVPLQYITVPPKSKWTMPPRITIIATTKNKKRKHLKKHNESRYNWTTTATESPLQRQRVYLWYGTEHHHQHSVWR